MDGTYILSVNYYNYQKSVPVPFTIFVAKEHVDHFENNYMVDPNNIACKSKTKIDVPQKIMGMVRIKGGISQFYFSETQIGNARSMNFTKRYAKDSLHYFISFYSNPIKINHILSKAGAIIISNPIERKGCDIDLSPETITKESFIKLLLAKEVKKTDAGSK
jgi:hypothetical protein